MNVRTQMHNTAPHWPSPIGENERVTSSKVMSGLTLQTLSAFSSTAPKTNKTSYDSIDSFCSTGPARADRCSLPLLVSSRASSCDVTMMRRQGDDTVTRSKRPYRMRQDQTEPHTFAQMSRVLPSGQQETNTGPCQQQSMHATEDERVQMRQRPTDFPDSSQLSLGDDSGRIIRLSRDIDPLDETNQSFEESSSSSSSMHSLFMEQLLHTQRKQRKMMFDVVKPPKHE